MKQSLRLYDDWTSMILRATYVVALKMKTLPSWEMYVLGQASLIRLMLPLMMP